AGDGIAVDGQGDAYVTGNTDSDNFPTTAGAFQRTYQGGVFDNFVTKFDPSGSHVLYSTYLGGNDDDEAFAIAIDSAGAAYVTGSTASANFPTTAGAFQRTFGGSQPAKTFDHFIDAGDEFVSKLNPTGSGLVYSTFLGGDDNDEGTSIAVDAAGNAFVSGHTFSTNFPTRLPVQAAIPGQDNGAATVSVLSTTGSRLIFSTYLGGGLFDKANGIAVDHNGNVYVTGQTESTTFPTSDNAFQPEQKTTETHGVNAFVTRLAQTEADLNVSVSVSPNPVRVGQNVTFTFRVTNLGPAPATGAVLAETFQGSFRFVSLNTTQGRVSTAGNTVTANLGTLAVGASATVTIVLSPLAAGTVQATARATTTAEENHGNSVMTAAAQVLGAIRFSPWLPDLLLFPNGVNRPRRPG
ncbi:MAG TPA: SBBP repeat-containing protein, partial [Gemmataceae bacterium]|nr:SBBP repeat-containing protein [Gemmataceae bacterium]